MAKELEPGGCSIDLQKLEIARFRVQQPVYVRPGACEDVVALKLSISAVINAAKGAIGLEPNAVDGKTTKIGTHPRSPFIDGRRNAQFHFRVAEHISVPEDLSVGRDSRHMPSVAFYIQH